MKEEKEPATEWEKKKQLPDKIILVYGTGSLKH